MTYTQNISPVHTLVSTPVTIVLTGGLLFILLTTFFTFFFCGCCVKKLLTAWYNHRNRARNLIRSSNPPEHAGLDPKIVQSFPTFPYSALTARDHGKDQCSICLTEFMDEDNLRLITTCRHSFHTSCIDLWFESHRTCPVCRCELDKDQIWSGKSPILPEMDHVRSESNELHNSISIIIQEHSPDQNRKEHLTSDTLDLTSENESYERRMEASNWRFWRSHSTGHSIVKTKNKKEEEGGKLLLRCLENVNVEITRGHCQTESCVEFGKLSCYESARECRWLCYTSIEIQQQN